VIERQQSTLPIDWPFARAFIELLANPENDTLAFFFMVSNFVKKGAPAKDARDAAHAAKRAASAAGKSLNRANLGISIYNTLPDVPELLRAWGMSSESRMLVAEKLKELAAGATVLDLALAMAGTKELVKEGTGEGVSVLTIHASKGREFDVVYLVGFEDEIIPGRRSSVDVEEERRLAYVAVTRARNVLVFSGAQSRVTPWGAINQHSPSRFVLEAVKGAAS
jgi:superfamily I DNA/RNA helicase